jgi:hypothetical protein
MEDQEMDKKKERLRKRDLALQGFYRKVQGLIKELDSKYPELRLMDDEPNDTTTEKRSHKSLARDNILYLHGIGEAQNGDTK